MAQRAEYRADIDGLRAVAVLAVVAFHAGLPGFRNGFAGVDIFFVISGYLITGIIVRALEKGTFSYREFYVRRINRILPSLIAVLIATSVVGWLVMYDYELPALGTHVVGGSTFVSNFVLVHQTGYFDLPLKPLLNLWSLAVEEQFYLLWPLVAVITWRGSRGRVVWVAFAIVAASWTVGWLEIQKGQATAAFYLPFGRFWEILAGALLQARVSSDDGELAQRGRAQELVSVAGAALLLISLWMPVPDGTWPGWRALVPVVGALFLINSGESWLNRRVLSIRPLVAIGLISYPLYLWHWPILTYSRLVVGGFMPGPVTVLAVATSFVMAVATYRFIEIPIRFGARKRRSAFRLLVGLGSTGALGVFMATGLTGTRSSGGPFNLERWGPDWVAPANSIFDHGSKILLSSQPGDPSRTVFFFGDSHMNQYWARVLELAAKSRGDFPTVSILAYGGCLPLPGVNRHGIDWSAKPWECDRIYRAQLLHAAEPEVKTVVISAWWDLYTRGKLEYLAGDTSSVPLSEGDPRLDRVFDQFERDLAALVSSGKRVYLVLPSPTPGTQLPHLQLPRRLMSFGAQNKGVKLSRAIFDAQTRWVTTRLTSIAAQAGVILIDPVPSLCDSTVCPTVMPSGLPVYWDDNHLRAAFVARYATFLDQVFK